MCIARAVTHPFYILKTLVYIIVHAGVRFSTNTFYKSGDMSAPQRFPYMTCNASHVKHIMSKTMGYLPRHKTNFKVQTKHDSI